jgi:hypothetical protein
LTSTEGKNFPRLTLRSIFGVPEKIPKKNNFAFHCFKRVTSEQQYPVQKNLGQPDSSSFLISKPINKIIANTNISLWTADACASPRTPGIMHKTIRQSAKNSNGIMNLWNQGVLATVERNHSEISL